MKPEEVQAIADAVGKAVVLAMGPKLNPIGPVTEPNNVEEVVYLDGCAKAADEEEMKLIQCLPRGVIAYKGKGGTRVVNHTEESMNFLNDYRRNKKSWRTQYNVR